MNRSGVELTLQNNVGAGARQAASELEAIAKSADNVNSSFDPQVLNDYEKQLTRIGESYSQLNNQQNNQQQSNIQMSRQLQGVASGAGTAITQAGRGDVGGAAMTGARGLGGLASMLGGPAALFGGIAIAGGMAGNALASGYQERSGPAQKLAALQDQLFTDVNANTTALRETMASTVESVAKYGKTYEEGARAQETFLRAGGKDFAQSRAAGYSMAYGADFSNLAAFEGLGQRYGQGKGLDTTRALMRAQGLGPAQFEEVMGGIQDTFSSLLSQGIVKPMEDIARDQEFFSRAGQTFQGGIGAQRLQGMNQAVTGAAGLQQQSDLFLYRAASGITGGDLLETKKLMEKGFSPEIYQGLMKEFDRMGYGKTESVLTLSKMFGLSTTASEQMYGLRNQDITNAEFEKQLAGGMAEGAGVTRESKYKELEENIAQAVTGVMGAELFDARAEIVGAGVDLIKGIKNIFTGEDFNIESINTQEIVVAGRTRGIGQDTSYGEIIRSLTTSQRGVTKTSPLMSQIEEAKAQGLSKEAIAGALGPSWEKFTGSDSESGTRLSSGETASLGDLLLKLIESTDKTTEAILEETVIVNPVSGGM